MNNRTILEKADLALQDLVTGGGLLKPVQAEKFVRLLMLESTLLKLTTAIPMSSPKRQISKLAFAQRVLRPAQEATALTQADRSKPDLSFIELDAKLFKAEVRLTDEQLEDNIERGDFRQTVIEMIASAVSRDMEEVAIKGDTTSADSFLATMDGYLRQAQSHVVDAAGTPLTGDILSDMLITMPSEYLRDRKQLRFFTSVDAELRYRRSLQQRETGIGDRFIEDDAPVQYSGVPVLPIPMFPENLGPQSNLSSVLFTHPKNCLLGVYRQIRMETDRDVAAGVWMVVVTLRFDVKLLDENGVVKAVQVRA